MCSYHSILECCGMFSGVKLSMGSFVLLSLHGLVLEHITMQSQTSNAKNEQEVTQRGKVLSKFVEKVKPHARPHPRKVTNKGRKASNCNIQTALKEMHCLLSKRTQKKRKERKKRYSK